LAACLWIRTAAPVDSFARLEAAAHDGPVVTTDRGHFHDPARQPHGTPMETSESEEQVGDDGDFDRESHAWVQHEAWQHLPCSDSDQFGFRRDPCVAQRQNRGPPVA
jgi:hypothetical protein